MAEKAHNILDHTSLLFGIGIFDHTLWLPDREMSPGLYGDSVGY